jgi:hypothetical protein
MIIINLAVGVAFLKKDSSFVRGISGGLCSQEGRP